MIFNHDVDRSLDLLVDLVNTAPQTAGGEALPHPAALTAWVERSAISEVGDLGPDDVVAVHQLRDRLREVWVADEPKVAAGLLNDLLHGARLVPRLTDHDGYDWHVHHFAPGSSLAEHLRVESGLALAAVVVAGELDRLRVCGAPGCSRVLVDLSRNRSKRYCDSRTCGNRLHVAAYRERRRVAEAG